MLRSDTFMYICILTECYILTSSCALGWRSVGLLRLYFFCRPSITNLVFRCGDILMSQQTVTKPLYNHIISNIRIIIWIHARHSFVLFSNQSQQPTKHVWKQILPGGTKACVICKLMFVCMGFPRIYLRHWEPIKPNIPWIQRLIPGKSPMRPWFLTPLNIKFPRCCSP